MFCFSSVIWKLETLLSLQTFVALSTCWISSKWFICVGITMVCWDLGWLVQAIECLQMSQ